MKNLKKKIISIFLVLVMVLTMLPADMGVDTAEAADTTGSLTLTYRWGTNNLIQMNTNLPSDTQCVNFTTGQNGCSIDESGNTVQWVGWIEMANVDGTIVLTFHFNNAFTAGQTYVLPKGAIFGFTDGKTYTLDGDYTFTFDGSAWTQVVTYGTEDCSVISFDGGNFYLQPVLDIPYSEGVSLSESSSIKDEKSTVTLDASKWGGLFQSGNNTLVSINLSAEESDTYIWEKGSVFSLSNGRTYELDATYVFTFSGTGWTMAKVASVVSFGGASNYLQPVLDIPYVEGIALSASSSIKDERSTVTLGASKWGGLFQSGNNTLVSVNLSAEEGETYVWEKGSIFVLSNGDSYILEKTYVFTYQNGTWTMESFDETEIVAERELAIPTVYGDVMQFGNFYDFGLSSQGTLSFEGTVLLDGEEVIVDGSTVRFDGYSDTTTIALYMSDFTNKILTIEAGSVISYNGVGVRIGKTFNAKYDGSTWTEVEYIPNSDIEGDANGDTNVDSMDLIRLKKVVNKAKDANNQCDLDVNKKYNGVDVHYLRLIILYGSISNLDVLDPLLYMGGEDFISFADLPVDATDTAKIAEFKALGFNTSLLTEDHASTSYSVSMSKPETAEIQLESEEKLLTLEYAGYTTGSLIQIKTNLPSEAECYTTSGGAFSLGQYGHELDMYSDSEVLYFQLSYDANSNMVYFNPVFKTYCDNGDKYILKAGTKLNIDGVYYVLDRTYTFTMENEYLASIQNLDNAGLNVWIRNYSNQAGYFTDYRTNLLALHKDKIDGFYMMDEPFANQELYDDSTLNHNNGKEEQTGVFADLDTTGTSAEDLGTWFNENYSNTYFHVNHIPMSSYNHYGETTDTKAEASNYLTFFTDYAELVLKNIDTDSYKKTIGYDMYPLGYSQTKGIWWWQTTEIAEKGIDPDYLVNMLIPAKVAKDKNTTFSVCIQTFDKINAEDSSNKREITTAAEVSFQLYSAMACGADMFEYFTYNSLEDTVNNVTFNGIIDLDENKTELYNEVKTANANAFSFADVINVFDWQGVQVSSASTSKNATGITTAENSGLGLLLNNNSNGVLSSVSSDDDAVVGYYTKGSQAGYMVANYNDPKLVTTNNTVTLTFTDCTKARVYTSVDGKLTSEVVTLTNNSYTHEVAPGGAFFIIPVNAQ